MDDSSFFNDLIEKGNLFVYKTTDTRKPRLSLKHVSKLRMYRALHQKDREKHLDDIKSIYGIKDDSAGGGF